MSEIKIETLTAVHVGSGETLQFGTDFLPCTYKGDHVISVVEPRKVLNLIGEANVHKWVASIERKETTSSVVEQFAPKAQLLDYAKRIIMEWSETKSTDTLKEHIHNGQGKPYIPGSSIKGAIRTAVLASLVQNVSDLERKIDRTKYKDFQGNPIPKVNINKVDAKNIESELFGSNPNEDIFRFVQVGDAYFGDLREVAVRMVNINERERQSFWDSSKSQLIEAIAPSDETTFHLKLNEKAYDLSKDRVHAMPDCLRSIPVLFETINNHTQSLLKSEIKYWKEREEDDDTERIAQYIEKNQGILDIARSCKNREQCVLRIGHGSGWRFITGAWAEQLNNFETVVIPASRPKNFQYEQYDFPKTRRVDEECELLGFVKLTIV